MFGDLKPDENTTVSLALATCEQQLALASMFSTLSVYSYYLEQHAVVTLCFTGAQFFKYYPTILFFLRNSVIWRYLQVR